MSIDASTKDRTIQHAHLLQRNTGTNDKCKCKMQNTLSEVYCSPKTQAAPPRVTKVPAEQKNVQLYEQLRLILGLGWSKYSSVVSITAASASVTEIEEAMPWHTLTRIHTRTPDSSRLLVSFPGSLTAPLLLLLLLLLVVVVPAGNRVERQTVGTSRKLQEALALAGLEELIDPITGNKWAWLQKSKVSPARRLAQSKANYSPP